MPPGRRAPLPSTTDDFRDSTRSSDGVIERLPLPTSAARSPVQPPRQRPGRGPPPPPPGPPQTAIERSGASSSSSSAGLQPPTRSPLRSTPPHARGSNKGGAFPFSMADANGRNKPTQQPTGANGTSTGGNYQSMHTPIESAKKKAPSSAQASDVQSQRVDDSSEDSYDNGSYLSDKLGAGGGGAGGTGGPNGDGAGWFHAKIQVDNAIQWSNNYKIQLTMFLMLVGGAAVTIVYANNRADSSVGVICGSIITTISCTSVVYTFLTRPTWRKHPNPIIFFRSLCDIGLVSVLLITELYKCGTGNCGTPLSSASCTATAGLTQFFLWSSESWFFVMAIDMLFSLQSPFTDYKRNVRRYHMFVWLTGENDVCLVCVVALDARTDAFLLLALCSSLDGDRADVGPGLCRSVRVWVLLDEQQEQAAPRRGGSREFREFREFREEELSVEAQLSVRDST